MNMFRMVMLVACVSLIGLGLGAQYHAYTFDNATNTNVSVFVEGTNLTVRINTSADSVVVARLMAWKVQEQCENKDTGSHGGQFAVYQPFVINGSDNIQSEKISYNSECDTYVRINYSIRHRLSEVIVHIPPRGNGGE
jgi:hypothetical protein